MKLQNLPQANMAILNSWIQKDLYTEGIKAVQRTIKLFGFVLKETRLNVKLEQLLTSNAVESKGLQIISTGDHNHASQYEYSWK